MPKKQSLTVSLEEFGLSPYEARAYVELVIKGTIAVSEVAFYTKIPRTKAYSVLRKLEKKRLAILSKSKPIMCTSIAPEDAFDSIIQEHIEEVNEMNTLVSDLKQLSQDSKKSQGYNEKRYFQINTNNVLSKLQQMIEGTKKSMLIAVDQCGLNLLSECKAQLVAAARRDLEIKIIMPAAQIGSEAHKKIPNGVKIKAGETGQNYFIFDHTELLFIDSDTGKAAVFSSTEILGASQIKSFNHMWRVCLKTESVADMTKTESQEIYKMIRIVDEHGLSHILNSSYVSKKNEQYILSLLEKNGIDFKKKTIDDVIEIIDSILQITCSGHANFDTRNKNISIESKINSGSSLPWANIVDSYLQIQGYKTRLVYQNNHQKGEKIHIKIQK